MSDGAHPTGPRAEAAPARGQRAFEATRGLRAFEPLRRAERLLLEACARGDIAKVAFVLPEAVSAGNSVRAGFVAFLARGGTDARRAPRRIQLIGAWIEGRLELSGESIASSLWFYRCVFDAAPAFDQARLAGSLAFPGCHLPGLHAEGCRIAGDLTINSGCVVDAEIELSRAVVRGRLDASRARLGADTGRPPVAVPLRAIGIRVGGDVCIGDGLGAVGELQFAGARIDGHFRAGLARLSGVAENGGGRGIALNLERACIAGDLRLDAGFSVAGQVRLKRVRVGGDLDANGAAFDLVGDAAWGDAAPLQLDRARVGGTLRLARLQRALQGVSLMDTRVGSLDDDALTWGDGIALDGFDYARFAPGAPVDAEFRIGWLMHQQAAHRSTDFRAAPWRRLIGVLRRSGHDDAAREVAIAREALRCRVGQVGQGLPPGLRGAARLAHRLWGAVAGYGHRPHRLLAVLAGLWLVGALLYGAADAAGAMTARVPEAARPAEPFEPLLHSLDRLVPGLDLHPPRDWRPLATADAAACTQGSARDCWALAARWAGWTQTLLGWAGTLAFVLAIAGRGRRDR